MNLSGDEASTGARSHLAAPPQHEHEQQEKEPQRARSKSKCDYFDIGHVMAILISALSDNVGDHLIQSRLASLEC